MERNLSLLAEFVKTCLQEGIAEKEVATSTHKSSLEAIFKNRRSRVEKAYTEQIEKKLRKSVLFFPQFRLPESSRSFSRNLEGIL